MIKSHFKLVFFYCIAFFLASCSMSEDEPMETAQDSLLDFSGVSDDVVLRINQEVYDFYDENRIHNDPEGDAFTIKSAKREDDIIQIELSYSGGCKKHTFEIIWDGLVYTDAPCHINLQLVHRANNDTCEALITETIFVNLKELIGDVSYKNECAYNIFSTYNSGETPNVVVPGL